MPKTCPRKETWSFNPGHGISNKLKSKSCNSEPVTDPRKILVKPVEITKLVFCCDISAEKVTDMPPKLRKRHKVVEPSVKNVRAGTVRNLVSKDSKPITKKSDVQGSKKSKESNLESTTTKSLKVSCSVETKYDLIKRKPRNSSLPKPKPEPPKKKSRLTLKSRCKGQAKTLETLVDILVPSDSITTESNSSLEVQEIKDIQLNKSKTETLVDVTVPFYSATSESYSSLEVQEVKGIKLIKSQVKNNIKTIKNSTKECDDKEESDFDDVFGRFKNELNFVLAKSVIKRKVGFKIDGDNVNATDLGKKMRRLLQQADLMKLKSVLDTAPGGQTGKQLVSIPKQFSHINEVNNNNEEISLDTPFGSAQTSPNVSVSEFSEIIADVDHMPILQLDSVKVENGNADEVCGTVPPTKKSKTVLDLVEERFYSSQVASEPEKLAILPQMKKISFKIPKKTSTKVSIKSWHRNAELWCWALTVDANCQFARSKNGDKQRVPWSVHIDSRPCDKFEFWLLRSADGDDMDWGMSKVDDHTNFKTLCEKTSRRQDVIWREQVVDRMIGVIPASKKASTLDETVVTDFIDDFDLDSETSDSVPDDDSDLDSVSSQQSLVTHIRTPPHIFVIDEVQLDFDENQQMESSTESVTQNCPLSPPLSLPADRLDEAANLSPSLCGDELNQDDRIRPDVVGVSGDNKLTSLMSALVKNKHARLRL